MHRRSGSQHSLLQRMSVPVAEARPSLISPENGPRPAQCWRSAVSFRPTPGPPGRSRSAALSGPIPKAPGFCRGILYLLPASSFSLFGGACTITAEIGRRIFSPSLSPSPESGRATGLPDSQVLPVAFDGGRCSVMILSLSLIAANLPSISSRLGFKSLDRPGKRRWISLGKGSAVSAHSGDNPSRKMLRRVKSRIVVKQCNPSA